MRRWLPWVLLVVLGAALWLTGAPRSARPAPGEDVSPGATEGVLAPAAEAQRTLPPPARVLPAEALETVARIQRGGPFPHRQDGGVFGNREGRLPRQPRGWYREYTVDTPGLQHRGARRIVTGGEPPAQWYYTDDHYDSFRRFDPEGAAR